MTHKLTSVLVLVAISLSSCSTTSLSTVVDHPDPAWEGPVLISEAPMPSGIPYRLIGSVKVDAQAGYAHADDLYPALAAEAKKIGANAVVTVKGGHKVAAWSWAAPYVTGTAVRVEDAQLLKALPGSFH